LLAFVAPLDLKSAVTRLTEVETVLTRIRDFAKKLPSSPAASTPARCEAWPNAVASVVRYAEEALSDIGTARDDADRIVGFTKARLRALSKGLEPMFPPRVASVVTEVGNVAALSSCVAADIAPMVGDAGVAARLLPEHQAAFDMLPTPPLERKVDRELSYTLRVLDVIFRELNIIAITPIVTFDVARTGPDVTRARSAIGGGVRFTLATLDVTASYAATLGPETGDSHGAFLFALDVSDLFR
jgi:hypothetical protein